LANRIEPVLKTKPPPPEAESAAEAAESAARAAAKAAATAPRSIAERARGRISTAARSEIPSGNSSGNRSGGPSGESGNNGGLSSVQSEDVRRAERVRTLASARRARQEEKALLLAEVSADRAMRNVRRPFATPHDTAGGTLAAVTAAGGGADAVGEGQRDDNASAGGVRDGWEPIESLPPTSDASARRSRLSVRLPAGGLVQMAWQGGRPPVWAVLEWLARLRKETVEELIESCALVDRSTVPPREVSCMPVLCLPSDPYACLQASLLAYGPLSLPIDPFACLSTPFACL
jgi:hypothetical protein